MDNQTIYILKYLNVFIQKKGIKEMELVSLKDISKESKILLLRELGYDSDGIFVLDSSGNKTKDRYTDQSIKIDNMLIFPGSTIVLDDNPLSILSYLEEFGDVL